jgi:RND family efflux transporter MFP subunit
MKNEIKNQEEISAEQEPEREGSTGELTEKSLVRKLLPAGLAGLVLIGLTGFGIWYFLLRGEGGRPVPAPRGVSFNDNSGGSEKLPAGEQKITLSGAQLEAAGLKIVTVGETLERVALEETTTGVVRANEYEETPVVSQVAGVVKSINADLGGFVRRGQTVAVVAREEIASAQTKYLSIRAELNEAEKRYRRALSLSGISEESRNELDKQTANLKAARAKLAEAKSNYERSRKLVEIGAKSRREFERTETELKVAEANLTEAQNRLERAKKLLKIDPVRKNEIDRFLTGVRKMQADLASAREKLLVLGLSRQRVDSLRSPGQISSDLPIPSPVTGTVTERIANLNEVVSVNGKIAQITDLSTVWVIGQVYEKNLGKLRIGSGASITSDAYPGEVFRGNISYIDPNLDEKTRTARVRIELANPGQKLKLGQFVNVAYATLGGSEKTAPLIPASAVQNIGTRKVVFEATADPKTFILRPVRTGQEKEGAYPVIEGIFVGDKIVTDGSFLLRAEFLKTNPAEF